MKRVIFGLILGAILAVPATAIAWNTSQKAAPTFGARCGTDEDNSQCDVIVDKYRDGANTCYVARTNVSSANLPDIALSCFKN